MFPADPPSGSRRAPGAVPAALLLLLAAGGAFAQDAPDLVVDANRLLSAVSVGWKYFPPDDCALVEGCVLAPGHRKLLRFATETANIGMADLYLGDPATNPLFEFSACHGHYHFGDYADHQLLDGDGLPVAPGFKTGFCLVDNLRYLNEPWVPLTPAYHCGNQGLQRGWSDIYGPQLDCQWVDVTDVPVGSYQLQVTVNPLGLLSESNPGNNSATVPVAVIEPPGIPCVPDGRFTPGLPVTAEHDGPNVLVRYDVASCPADDYNLFFGAGDSVASYEYAGAFCNLGADGQESLPLPDPPPGQWGWFVIAGRVGSQEGAHGYDSSGALRPATGVGMCGILGAQVTRLCS